MLSPADPTLESSVLDHRFGDERSVHARRRGGVHAPRLAIARPRPAHRHGARRGRRQRPRGPAPPGADAVGARDLDAGVPEHRRRRPRAAAPARRRHAGGGRDRPPRRLGRHAPVQPLRAAAHHRPRPLPRARRPAPVRRAPRADLRHAHPRRDRRPGEGDRRPQRPAPPPAGVPRAQRELAVLARGADGPLLDAPARLRRVPALGPAPALPGLRATTRASSRSSSARAASRTTRRSGGTSGRTRAWGRSRCGSATPSRASRTRSRSPRSASRS